MAVITPMGITAITIRITKATVPKMAGNIPPSVIPSLGAEVKNSQLKTWWPLSTIFPIITARIANIKNMANPDRPAKNLDENF
jgi:hypothetical protein